MRAKTGADGENALPFFQFPKRTVHKAAQGECAGFQGLERFSHVLRLPLSDDVLHWLWHSDRDQSCAGSQRRASGEDGSAAFSQRTGEKQYVAVSALVRIGCADERERGEFLRLGPTSGALADFLDQRSG